MTSSRIRLVSIDALRGLAVILMFFHHFPEYLMRDPYNSDTFILMFVISRLSAPLFLIVVGISMALSANNRAGIKDKKATISHYIKRGFTLIIGGALLNLMTYASPAKFNILYTIGLSLIFFSILAVRPSRYTTATALVAVLFLTEGARLFGPLDTILARFDFPPFPWMIFTVYGLIIGDSLVRFCKTGRLNIIVWYLEATSVLLMALTAAYIYMGIPFIYRGTATLPFISLAMAASTYLLSLFILSYEVHKFDPLILRPLKAFGRFALPVYFIHYVFVVTIPHALGFKNSLTLLESLASLAVFTMISYLAIEKANKPRKRPS